MKMEFSKKMQIEESAKGDPMAGLLLECLSRSGRARVRVHGSSMRPFIKDGDVVLVEHTPASVLRTGDIAACYREGSLVVHRLLCKARGRLYLKGDTFASPDHPIPYSEYLGRVTAVETRAGILDLTTQRARTVNLLTLVYMIPVSLAYSVYAFLFVPGLRPRRSLPRFLRSLAEKLPASAARSLVRRK